MMVVARLLTQTETGSNKQIVVFFNCFRAVLFSIKSVESTNPTDLRRNGIRESLKNLSLYWVSIVTVNASC